MFVLIYSGLDGRPVPGFEGYDYKRGVVDFFGRGKNNWGHEIGALNRANGRTMRATAAGKFLDRGDSRVTDQGIPSPVGRGPALLDLSLHSDKMAGLNSDAWYSIRHSGYTDAGDHYPETERWIIIRCLPTVRSTV